MVRRLVLLAAWLLLPFAAQAITWDFDTDGNTQGWVARDGQGTGAIGSAPLYSEVRDGVWRITPVAFFEGITPAVLLNSPLIKKDSGLFDRFRIRLRVVHSRPYQSGISLKWRNTTNAGEYPGRAPPQDPNADVALFYDSHQNLTFTTEWQEVEVGDLRSQEGYTYGGQPPKWKRVWEGELLELALHIGLSSQKVTPSHPEDMPEAVEIDWIQLTGAEEQLQGEGAPPVVEAVVSFGGYFAPAAFSPLGRGVWTPTWIPMAALGDVDGDQDLDLVTMWVAPAPSADMGWLVATNEGQGRLVTRRSESGPQPFSLGGGDVDGDGLLDLVLRQGTAPLRLLHNEVQTGWVVEQEFPGERYLGVGDADGDGDADLWTTSDSFDQVRVWLNDGSGRFAQSLRVGADLIAQGFMPWSLAYHLRQGTGVLWRPPLDDLGQGYEVSYLEAGGEVVQKPLATSVDPFLIRYAGDFDQDGDVDLVVSRRKGGVGYTGLDLLVNQGDGQMVTVPWQEEMILAHDVQFFDLNGDAVLDPVFVDTDLRGPAAIVSLGQKGGAPVQEGRYPLTGIGGMVLGGDVDVDGDVDLVVLERAALGTGEGGVHVLLNQRGPGVTAVLEAGGIQPAAFHLGVSYPNPFNPGVVIPFALGSAAVPVNLTIYNTLGQEVRKLELGALPAGTHQVAWDGQDEAGKVLSSGVYLYRLQAGTWSATGKMVKSE